MYSFAQAPSLASGTLWTWMLVSREIDGAIAALEEAVAAVVPLVDATDWQSDGSRALHQMLGRLRDDTEVEIGRLRTREEEMVAGGGA